MRYYLSASVLVGGVATLITSSYALFSQNTPASISAWARSRPLDSIRYDPVIYLDDRPYAGSVRCLDPDSIARIDLSTSGDTLHITSLAVTARSPKRWISQKEALRKSVKSYYIDWNKKGEKQELAALPPDEIKCIEFDGKASVLSVFTHKYHGLVISSVDDKRYHFFVPLRCQATGQQCADSLFFRLAEQASARFASFQGKGVMAFVKWVSQQVQYPSDLLAAGVEGKVRVLFSIDQAGNIGDYQILETPHMLLALEVIRVLKQSPPWKPASLFGRPCKIVMVVPVVFQSLTQPDGRSGRQE